jgi:glycosyltransferase involved in cell wall biosynthesis
MQENRQTLHNNPGVSIIVPCRNEKDTIEACLHGILCQEPPPGGFEVIVADGLSDDGTRDILQRVADGDLRVRVIDNAGRIVSSGLNAAIRAARGGIIIRMDAHTDYAPDYIRQCVAVLQESGADNVGGAWIARGKGLRGRAVAAASQSPFAIGDPHGHNADYEGFVDTVYLGCWPRRVFETIGLFDEELVRNQDDEFNLRLTRAGGKICQSPRIQSWYTPRESLKALFCQYRQYGYWKVRVIQKHRLPASARHLVPGCFVLVLMALPLASIWWPILISGWLSLVTIYVGCTTLASLLTAARCGWELLFILPVVFACYHLGYGSGFLRGVFDFVILQRTPNPAYTKLTRGSPISPT